MAPNELLVGGVENVEFVLLLPVLVDEVCVADRRRAVLIGELHRHCRVVCRVPAITDLIVDL